MATHDLDAGPAPVEQMLLSRIRAAYDAVAEPYAADFADELERKPLDRSLLDAFARLCQAGDALPVADLGCGPGHIAHYLQSHGLAVLGIDASPAMVGVARTLYPTLDVREGSLLELPLPEAGCAGVLALYSIIHLPPRMLSAALREFHRVLHPGGVALLGFHTGDGHVHVDEWYGRQVSLDGYLFDPTDVAAELEGVGLRVEARLDRRPHPEIEIPTERTYLLARRTIVSG